MSHRTALAQILNEVIAPDAELARMQGKFPRAAVTALGRVGLLGLTVSPELGGGGAGFEEAADVVAEVGRVCPAAAAVLRSHYAATAVVEAYGSAWLRGEIASGRHLCSLALVEQGGGESDAPRSTAHRTAGEVVTLRGRKRQVVAAGEADSYVWSTRPCGGPAGEGPSGDGQHLWLVPAHAPDLFVPARPVGSGPRGSATSTVCADPVRVPAGALLGDERAMADVLRPWLLASGPAAPDRAPTLVTS
ncbi:acyl-CoA dehydrogenase family protein [Streptomyces sp. VRA16 Mangrove soil]|uniref:acyl-CoA dehydrogenase family protein n=1 Tax=Streptomyces sp. VRA16 Mangrove soil TaxID=2817434 RepID=UPI001A9D02DB|nr:acyl-CoA dehydrogenase family protein [Streptomyces sp. VRA16 Mangrove soil]MBO1330998.1 acyl-CoA/acyl-ACP dehydrogenase [Streptomyces sp. VRA16 Mangrove soil]